jgi:hypothetical protein
MTKDYAVENISFTKPAVYKIIVQGMISPDLAERLCGMQVTIKKGPDKKTLSTLTGMINDQSQLSGILNTLYEMRMTVIAVNMLSEING